MNFAILKTKLLAFGVPENEIAPLEPLIANLGKVLVQYTALLEPTALRTQRDRLQLNFVQQSLKTHQEALSTRVIGLLKLYTGFRVLVVWGGARIKVNDPAYVRMVEAVSKSGEKWIVIDGCGPGIMEAALEGAKIAGAIRVGLRMVSNKAFETTLDAAENRWAEGHDFCFDHHDFFSRVAAFLAFADAVIIGKSGLGGTQEKSWLEGSIQCNMMSPIPVFIFSPDYWQASRAHFDNMLAAGAVSAEDRDLIRYVPEGEESQVFERIDKYYEARPQLLCAAEPVVLPTAVNSVPLKDIGSVSETPPVAGTKPKRKRVRKTTSRKKSSAA